MNLKETSRLIGERNIAPKKSMGQNFLIDDRVAKRHVEFAAIEPGDSVLEVGPGLGILTEKLLEVSNNVTAIELDRALANYNEEMFGDRLSLIHGDALKIDFPKFDRFVSNLPYSISTPIIFKLLEYDFKKAVIMVQKEFAERMVANHGELDYSKLSVNIFYHADCKILETVPASRFKPRPKVDSALVEIIPRAAPFTVKDEATFFKVVDAGFKHRRKKIRSALRTEHVTIPNIPDIPFLDDRIEVLSPADIGRLSDVIFDGKDITG